MVVIKIEDRNVLKFKKFLKKEKISYTKGYFTDDFIIKIDNITRLLIFLKNNIKSDLICSYNVEHVICSLAKKNRIDDISELYDNKIIVETDIAKLLPDIYSKYDLDIIIFFTEFITDHDYFTDTISYVCHRNDDNTNIMQYLLNHYEHNGKIENYIFILRQSLRKAIVNGKINIIKLLIEDYKVEFEDYVDYALQFDEIEIAEYLIEIGADINAALDKKLFIDKISKNEPQQKFVYFYINYPDFFYKYCNKALITASKDGSLETVIALIETGCYKSKHLKKAMNVCIKRPHIYNYINSSINNKN